MSRLNEPAMPSKYTLKSAVVDGYFQENVELCNDGLTIREQAAIALRVPMSGNAELDAMIRVARRQDIAAMAQTQLMREFRNVTHLPLGKNIEGCLEIAAAVAVSAADKVIAELDKPEVEKGWWCPECQKYVDGRDVTFEETHDTRSGGCGYRVVERGLGVEECK